MSADVCDGLDRRAFLGVAGATLAFGTWPLVLEVAPSLVPASQALAVGTWDDWSIDDICHPLPRPTAPIGLGRRAASCGIGVADVDRQFCA